MRDDDRSGLPADNQLLRALVDNVSAMLAYWDTSLRCRFANRAYEHWFGVTPESLIGKHISELLGPLYPLNLPYIERVLRGEPQQFEREIPDPRGGPPRFSLAHYVPDVVDGTVRGFFVLVSDISAVKRAEIALRESEERFRLTVDEAPIGMALVAPDGRFTRVNRALCEIVGYTADELTGTTFQAITHPDDLDTDLALAGQLARGEIPRYELEKRYIRKDGNIVHVNLSGAAVRRPDGTPRYFIAQIEDISRRKKLEDEQRFLAEVGPVLASTLEYEENIARVANLAVRDLADLCIMDILDEDGAIRRINVTSRDPSRGWVCDALRQYPLDRSRPFIVKQALETRQSFVIPHVTAETVASFAQNDEHHELLRAADMRSIVAVPLLARDQLLGAIALISTSPSRVYGPDDVRLAEELARRAALSIDNARLYREAKRATKARDDVLGVVAHDLRNPLSTIVMNATSLRRPASAQQSVQQCANAIARAATRMNRLIQDLLDVTRLEAGHFPLECETLSAARLITDCIDSRKPLAASASIALRVAVADGLPEVRADRDRLLQVFENLVGNAMKFTPRGGTITVAAATRNGDVLFSVSDTGRGIAAADLPHVFDRFWRAKNDDRGAGLGLPIVKGIVEAHRGRVWAESVEGRGSTFYFTVPRAPAN